MQYTLQQMSVGEYAATQSRFGAKIVERNGFYWRRIRPFFYRPLLPTSTFGVPISHAEIVSWPDFCQYTVPTDVHSNSNMHFIMLHDLDSYSIDTLGHKRRNMITRAAQQFEVRPITNRDEFGKSGHDIYLSFFKRTRYDYKSDRTIRAKFDRWADHLFENPKTVILGGYTPNGLAAFSTSYWVERTLIYTTLVCESGAMKKNLGELMFHGIRRLAGQQRGLDEILVRNYQGGNSIDQYYLLRGCKLVTKPAVITIPTLGLRLLRHLAPAKHKALVGMR